MCANSWLMNEVLRKRWKRDDAYITTDCGAVHNTMGPPLNLKTQEEAAAAIINGGTDLEMGSSIWNSSMLSAVSKRLVSEATVTASCRRALMQRMVQGDFDPVESVRWSSIGAEAINSSAHQAVAYDAALQSMVLLKNEKQAGGVAAAGAPAPAPALPLRVGSRVAVVGPGSLAQHGLVGPYFGDCICYAKDETRSNYTYDCIPTIASQIELANEGGVTTVAEGVSVAGFDASGVAPALALVDDADAVVLVIGIDHTVEHEGRDVTNSSLPGLQEEFALKVMARASAAGKSKPVVLVLLGNDGARIDRLVPGAAAIVRAFYPATLGAKALASLLFGKANRWGKLPLTMYPAGYEEQLPKMGAHTGSAYEMAAGAGGPGRSVSWLFPNALVYPD